MRCCEEGRGSAGLYSALLPMPQGEKSPRDTMSGGMKTEGRQTELWGLLRKDRQTSQSGAGNSQQKGHWTCIHELES